MNVEQIRQFHFLQNLEIEDCKENLVVHLNGRHGANIPIGVGM